MIRQIHRSLLVAASDYAGRFPTPGLVDRLPVSGVDVTGQGEENELLNTTANLYSLLIMQDYVSPELLISPLERNPNVKEAGKEAYNFEAYLPASSQYWDPNFKADLATESNVSYAHLPLFGEPKKRWWQESLGGRFALLGSRGPKDGEPDPDSYTCDRKGNWSGNIAFTDGSVEWLTVMQVPAMNAAGSESSLDNLFAIDEELAENDMMITFTRSITETGPEYQHD